jgi:putative transposase
VSERLACRVLGQHSSTQRKTPKGRVDDAALTADIVALATEYGRYGYRRITAMLQAAGWAVNVKRVERIWRLEGLKVPGKQPKKSRLWLNDAPAFGSDPSGPIMSGLTTSSRTALTTAGSSACSMSSMSSPSAWRSGSIAS